jgi:hypothetical protein
MTVEPASRELEVARGTKSVAHRKGTSSMTSQLESTVFRREGVNIDWRWGCGGSGLVCRSGDQLLGVAPNMF